MEEGRGQLVLFRVALGELRVWFYDCDQFDISAGGGSGNEAVGMVVSEADDREADGVGMGERLEQQCGGGEEEGGERVHGGEMGYGLWVMGC